MFSQSPLLKAVPDWSMAPRPRATRRAAPAAEEPEEPEMAPQLERKRTALAALQLLPEAEQPKSTVVSLQNEIRALEEEAQEPTGADGPAPGPAQIADEEAQEPTGAPGPAQIAEEEEEAQAISKQYAGQLR